MKKFIEIYGGSFSMPQKVKLNYEERLELINDYLEGKIGYREAQKRYCKFQFILEQYRHNGEEGLRLTLEKNKVYSGETKLSAVTEYLAGTLSIRSICAKYKISSESMLLRWIKVYNEHGSFNHRKSSGGGSYMKETRKTSYEERIQIAKECIETGNNYGEIALKHNISYQQARTWAKRYAELGEAGLEDRRGKRTASQQARTVEEELRIKLAQLEHENYMLRVERDLLKKLDEIERGNAFRK